MTEPITLIHDAATSGAHQKLDEQVHILTREQQHLLSSVTTTGPWHFLDVPAVAVVAQLNPQRGAPPSPYTWRQAALCIQGKGWLQEDIAYLEQPFRVRPMPVAPGARYALKLTSYAGAVLCTNGVHRLAAAMAWQLREGATGKLHMAATHMLPEKDGRVQSILDFSNGGHLQFALIEAPAHVSQVTKLLGAHCDLLVRRAGGNCEALLAFPAAGGKAIQIAGRSWLKRTLASDNSNRQWSTGWFDWNPLPQEFVDAWRRRAWLALALAEGEDLGMDEPSGPMFA